MILVYYAHEAGFEPTTKDLNADFLLIVTLYKRLPIVPKSFYTSEYEFLSSMIGAGLLFIIEFCFFAVCRFIRLASFFP